MVKIKKFISLLFVILVILSNIAFAQDSDPSSYEGRAIDPEKEGKEYYKEGNITVYPAQASSDEKDNMGRFNRGELSEEEMKKMAKEKLGDKFDEMEFKKSMIESQQRAERKDSFSYENEGYQGYYQSPSYEGYSKDHMIFGMLFEYIGKDIDPRDIKQNCNEPDKIANMVIGKLKEKIGDFQSVCKRMDEQESKCEEQSKKGCSHVGAAFVREGATDMEKLNSIAYSCPPNKDVIVNACKKRNMLYMEQRLNNLDEECRKRFDYGGERLVRECERFKEKQVCDKEKYVERCMGGIKKEENNELIASTTGKKCNSVPASCPTISCIKGAVPYLNPKTCCPDCKKAPISVYSDENKAQAPNQPASSPCPPFKDTDCPWGHSNRPIYDNNGCFVKFECCLNLNFIRPLPCDEGYELTLAVDEHDCFYYKCQPISNQPKSTPCPPYESNCKWGVNYSIYDNNGCIVKFICNCPYKRSTPKYCPKDYELKELVDEYGCPYYECQPQKKYPKRNTTETTDTCPEIQIPTCPESQTVQKRSDENSCISYYCETNPITPVATPTIATCPEQQIPSCQSGQILQKKADDKGCGYYYCERTPCPEVSKPICNADEQMHAYYDNAGCTTSYQCTKTQTACPTVTKPSCPEGQSPTAKYDDKGCVVGYECVSASLSTASSATGAVVLSTYDDFLRHCQNSWMEQEKVCSNTPKACDKEDFIQKCKDQGRKHSSDMNVEIERNCRSSTESELRHAEEKCSRIDDERKKCIEQSVKRCEQMKGNAEKCKELMTEERVRKFIVEEVTKRCKFKDMLTNEEDVKRADNAEIVLAVLNTATEDDIGKLKLFIDELKEDLKLQDTTIYKGMIDPNNFGDIKLLPFVVNAKISAARSSERAKEVKEGIVASSNVEEAASKLASLRDSNVPAEYLYIIEDKASEVLDASDKLQDVENKDGQKGIGYKIKLFLGLAKAAELEEIKQLQESNSKLQNSIETLTKIIEEVPSDVAKSILKEQVDNLKVQQADIKVLIDSKERKAKGWFGVFG